MVRKSEKKLATSQRKRWQQKLRKSGARSGAGRTNKPLRVVVDTNVWYSAILYGGNAEVVIDYSLSNTDICLSSQIVDELFSVIKEKTDAPYKWRRRMRIAIEKRCEIVDVEDNTQTDLRDPRDEHVIAAAITMEADLIITGDQDLLVLGNINDIAIVGLADFLNFISK